MQEKNIVPNERECISQCIFKYWSSSSKAVTGRDRAYEQCLNNCNVCASA